MLHPHELGKVQPGYYADLILVDGNPLEDISVLTATNGKLDVIMIVGGQFMTCQRNTDQSL